MTTPDLPTLRLVAAPQSDTSHGPARPAALAPAASRGDGGPTPVDDLLESVQVEESWEIGSLARGDGSRRVDVKPDARLLALEAEDGTTVFIRADALAERLARLAATRPELRHDDDGTLDLTALRPRDAQSRGIGEWVWRKLTALTVGTDSVTKAAHDKLAELTGSKVEDLIVAGGTYAGAKAIVWAIEVRGRKAPGLYAWNGGAIDAETPLSPDAPAVGALTQKPGLIFIHGTGSHTLGGFGQLPGTQSWSKLIGEFEDRLFGFEHHTFSESPIDNALALAKVLPAKAMFSIVTHSRGGLVGDLLCIDTSADHDETLADLIRDYRPAPRKGDDTPTAKADLERFIEQEQAKLTELIKLLRTKAFQIKRYVRVAAPARGTALLTDNLEIFLSGLLNLIRKAGGWAAGAIAGTNAGPAAAAKAKAATDKGITVLTRIVVEIANRRLDPRLLPGIEAMLPDAAMGMLLASAPHSATIEMAIIAGDIEGDGLAKRLGTLFTDWMFFDRADNDLVVDTASMYGGLACKAGARAIFVQGENVNHFRYFRDDTATADGCPLPSALHRWLTADAPTDLPEWATRALPELDPDDTVAQPQAPRSRGDTPAPILVFLPGIMGSNLDADDKRVWLDPLGLARGTLSRIAFNTKARVAEAGLVGMAYGKLAAQLGTSHQVDLFDYDWRQPIAVLGQQLADRLTDLLDKNPNTPVRILAHSMGGLVVRAAFALKPALWDAIVARPEGRLVMLGTPNCGSHLFVATLLGQSDTIRLLARVDLRHDMQEILDIVAGFPGAVHLLPAPGFSDTGNAAVRNYYDPATWDALTANNDDFWFGRQLGGKPGADVLKQAADFWGTVADTSWVRKAPDRIAYVFGQSENTPCGIVEQKRGGIVLRGTPDGDGSVTWASGHLPDLPDDRKWLMPVDHMGLTSTEDYFYEIEALLERGNPRKLGQLPVSRGDEAAAVREYRAGPPEGFPSQPEATARLLGGRLRPAAPRSRNRSLKVSVTAMDLRFVHIPVLCGHYRGDPIAAAEGVIDRYLVRGALSQRQRLGIHTGEIGNASIVLMPRNLAERQRQTGCGAVVVGLGEMGKLTADGVSEAVRGGVLRYLLHAADRYGEEQVGSAASPGGDGDTLHLKLASLLIGTNSALQLDVAESVKAVVLGVLMANRDFAAGEGGTADNSNARRALVSDLQFIEVFHDSAISAAHAVSQLGSTLASELKQMNFQLEPADELFIGEGVRQRLSVSPFSDYWPRLVVCDADQEESDIPPGATTPRFQPPIPPENLRQLLRIYGCADKVSDGAMPMPFWLDDAPTIRYASRLKFIYMGDKARAESIVQIRQPGLVEKLCDDRLKSRTPTLYAKDSGFGTTLFQLLVPLDFKAAARQANNLLLMVDETTANLPWEMLEVDGRPMVLHTRVVRQFMTSAFRRQVVRTDSLSACVIAEPSTDGFHAQFGGADWKPRIGADGQPEPDCLDALPGAAAEGSTVSRVLSEVGYEVTFAPPESQAADVFTRLYARPYRILMVSAHGIHGKRAADGSYRSGVVLSNGLLLTAAEIGQMENVPDLVFLNCCHLGKIGTGSSRLAASLARELIDMGVRCVVAAGWEVHDGAARTFIETFFEQMAQRNTTFGEAITIARAVTFDAFPDHNTWGAYQAYGDPAFQLKVRRNPARDDAPMRAPNELIDWIEQRRIESRLTDAGQILQSAGKVSGFKQACQRIKTRLRHVPEHWTRQPEVQQSLGRLYAAYGLEGFDEARKAWLQAIRDDSSRGLVPISAIEQLANLEARQAEALSRATPDATPSPDALDTAQALAESAVARLRLLLAVSAERPEAAAAGGTCDGNAERLAILGSTLKRKAVVLARCGKPWSDVVAPLLAEARDAYAQHQGTPDGTPNWNPYNYLNRLQLDTLLNTQVDYGTASAACDQAAKTRFRRTFDFFDAVMSADARLTCWARSADCTPRDLAGHYLEAMRGVTVTPRELESVTSQILILSDLLKCRGTPGDAEGAAALVKVVAILRNPKLADETPADASPAPAPAPAASPAAPAAKRKPKKSAAAPKAGAGKKPEN